MRWRMDVLKYSKSIHSCNQKRTEAHKFYRALGLRGDILGFQKLCNKIRRSNQCRKKRFQFKERLWCLTRH